jgi:hypothetical protein
MTTTATATATATTNSNSQNVKRQIRVKMDSRIRGNDTGKQRKAMKSNEKTTKDNRITPKEK